MSDELDLDTQEEAPQEEVIEKTMDDTIRETLEAIEARDKEPDEETDEQKAERARDEKGRFAAKDAAPQEQTTEASEPPGASESPPDPEAAAPTVPPELQRLGLRKEEADAIASNPVAMQAFMRRSEEMHKGLEQYREKAQFGDQMAQAIQPFAATIQSLGVHPAQAVQKLMAADHSLRYGNPQQKQQMILQIARDYGVDLNEVQQYQAEQPYIDPQVQSLQQRLDQMQGWIQQQSQAREQQERAVLNSEIASFASDPANNYFENVKNDMAGLLQAGLASTLKEAYDKAIFANPTIRAQVLAQQQARSDDARKQEASHKALAAKKAASVNVSRKGVMPAQKPLGTMEDTIRETAMRLGMI